jgi:serine/threonine-protein kinase
LPLTEVSDDAARRLGIYCLIWLGLWSFGLFMNNVLAPLLSPDRPIDDAWPIPGNPAAAIVIVASAALFLFTRRSDVSAQTLLDLGLVYEVALALGIGLVNQWTPNVTGLSWICVLVVLHPLVVPNTSGKTLVAALVAASMDPLGLAITAARGVEVPELAALIWVWLPNYICAALSVVPSRILGRLRQQVEDARELGSYRLGELIARGGMGEIYRASHRMLQRPAAIKLIRRDTLYEKDVPIEALLRRFHREAQAAAALHSPHTIALYDFGSTRGGGFYYVMELLQGLDLESLVSRFGPLPADRARRFLLQTCHSLAEAHAMGLVHRDIKPANLFVCRLGLEPDFLKVLDFGLVRALPDANLKSIVETDSTAPRGTPAYMAPEIAMASGADARSDIYSLGCVAYWLLTGSLLFDEATPMRMMLAHVDEQPIPPSRRTEMKITSGLEAVVMACLEKKPDDRPASALELARRLEECATEPRWTDERAVQWWRAHMPECAPPTGPPPASPGVMD